MSRFYLLILLFTGIGLTDAYTQTPDSAVRLSVQEFAHKMRELPEAPIIDVRTPQEYSGGHIPNAMNIDWFAPDFNQQMAAFDKGKPIFIYCRSGNRSGQALKRLQSDGFTRVYELKEGIVSWIEEGLPQSGH